MQRNGRIYFRSKLLVVLIARLYVCIKAFAAENVPFPLDVVESWKQAYFIWWNLEI